MGRHKLSFSKRMKRARAAIVTILPHHSLFDDEFIAVVLNDGGTVIHRSRTHSLAGAVRAAKWYSHILDLPIDKQSAVIQKGFEADTTTREYERSIRRPEGDEESR